LRQLPTSLPSLAPAGVLLVLLALGDEDLARVGDEEGLRRGLAWFTGLVIQAASFYRTGLILQALFYRPCFTGLVLQASLDRP
jgi:hypothetical protein